MNFREQLLRVKSGGRMYRAGDSSSDSSNKTETSTTNNTTYQDKRGVTGDGGVVASGDGNVIYNTSTDFGSVQAALTTSGMVATKAVDLASASITGVLAQLAKMGADQANMFNKTLDAVGANTKNTQEAFAKATEEVNGNRTLVGMGIVAIGLIAAQGAFK